MKKTLLLSVVASAMIMAGGDIAPVEPAVAAPAASGWDFGGQAVFYYQTTSNSDYDLFDQEAASANAGIQLRAANNDLFAGIGAFVELSGLATLGLEEDVVAYPMQVPSGDGTLAGVNLTGGWISQAYLTYGFGNTSIKVGRQELSKELSPLAYSEDWNVFKNTFDAVVVVNNDLPDTTAVLAWVKRANWTGTLIGEELYGEIDTDFPLYEGMNEFRSYKNTFMVTLQNKSIENVTLTGSWYSADGDNLFWADAQIAAGDFNIGLQAAHDEGDVWGYGDDDVTAYGAKVSTSINNVNVMAAYSSIDFGQNGHFLQLGGTTSALYTNMIADEILSGYYLRYPDNSGDTVSKWVLGADMDAFGGNVAAAYGVSKNGDYEGKDLKEFDLSYTTNVTDDISVSATYANISTTNNYVNGFDMLRFVARYNF